MSLDLSRIGQILKETREAKGLRLQDVSDTLYLRKSIVEALEGGSWDRLPHQVYVRGYLNQYASYLGIEDKIAEVAQIPEQTEALPSPEPVETREKKPSKKRFSEKLRTRYPRQRFVMYGMGAAILLGFLAYQNINRPSSFPSPAGTYAVSNTAYQTGVTSLEGPSTAVLELKKLVIACQERTWIRIVIDETEKKEFMLNPEEMVAFNAKEGFDLLIGNAGGVTLLYNGKNIGFAGENGEVKRVRLP